MPLSRRRLLAVLATAGAAAGSVFGVRAARARYYEGPVSDHFNGTRFFDPQGAPPKSLLQLLRWQTSRAKAAWPDHIDNVRTDRPPPRVEGARMRVSCVGHASFLIQTGGLNILTDPVWSERVSPLPMLGPKRVRDPGIAFEALPPIDAVLVSHCHYDHLDLPTLSRLAASHRPRVITPLGNDAIMLAHDPAIRVEAHDWGDRVELSAGMRVSLAPMRHWSARGPFDRNKALWAAFVLDTPWGRIYHVGDSGYGDGHHFRTARERHGPFRLAILPVGAYEPRWFMRDQHMNPQEAVQAFRDCGAEYALAHHLGVFQLTDEAVDAPELALNAALAAARIPQDSFAVLDPGEIWEM
jgi:L-ascorbate metabolism protein UlaG (beta-lactamase superfamily)